VNLNTFIHGDPEALPRSYTQAEFEPGELRRRWLATQPLGKRVRSIVRSARIGAADAIHTRAEFHSWQYRLWHERRYPIQSFGRYEGEASVLIAEWLDSNLDWVMAEGGDTDHDGWLGIFPLCPWQRDGDPARWGLWIDGRGFRTATLFATHGAAFAYLDSMEPVCGICGQQVDDDGLRVDDDGCHYSCGQADTYTAAVARVSVRADAPVRSVAYTNVTGDDWVMADPEGGDTN